MDVFECIRTKLDIRGFSNSEVSEEIILKILEAARLTGSALNTQHWRFILVKDKGNIKKLADDSTSGKWVANASFAVIILTNPKYDPHMIDAGRVLQNMQLAAWSEGVGSGLFTGVIEEKLRKDFEIPNDLNPTVIMGFGYPATKITGNRKNRLTIDKLVSYERYDGNSKTV